MKINIFLAFGILFFIGVFISYPLLAQGSSDNPESLISSQDPNYDFANQIDYHDFHYGTYYGTSDKYMESGSVIFKDGCQADISKLIDFGDNSLDLKVEGSGVTLSRKEGLDDYLLKYSGDPSGSEIIELNGQKLILGPGDQITISNKGIINSGTFTSIDGESYDIGPFSVTPSKQGEIKFDFNSEDGPVLSLPDESIIEPFNEKDFKKLEPESLTIKGNHLKISEGLAKQLFGVPSDNFKTFNGELKFTRALRKQESSLEAPMYLSVIPSNGEVEFPNAGVKFSIENERELPLVFGLGKGHFNTLDAGGEEVLGDKNYICDGVSGVDYLSLGDDEMYFYDIGITKLVDAIKFKINFKKGSNYGGFNIEDKDYLSFSITRGEATFKQGLADFGDSNPDFSVINGKDKFSWKGNVKNSGLKLNVGNKDSTNPSFKIYSKHLGEVDSFHVVGAPAFAFTNKDVLNNKAFKKEYYVYDIRDGIDLSDVPKAYYPDIGVTTLDLSNFLKTLNRKH